MNIGSDLSFFSLIWEASLPVQAVMLILVIASLASWKIIYLKIKTLKMAEQNTDDFEKIFWSGGSLSNLYESVSIRPPKDMLGLPIIFKAGYKEYMSNKNTGALDKKSIESVRRAMSASYNREVDTIDRHLPLFSISWVSQSLYRFIWNSLGNNECFYWSSKCSTSLFGSSRPGDCRSINCYGNWIICSNTCGYRIQQICL